MGFLDMFSGLAEKAINAAEKVEESGYMESGIKEKAYNVFKNLSSEEQDAVNDRLNFKFPKD